MMLQVKDIAKMIPKVIPLTNHFIALSLGQNKGIPQRGDYAKRVGNSFPKSSQLCYPNVT